MRSQVGPHLVRISDGGASGGALSGPLHEHGLVLAYTHRSQGPRFAEDTLLRPAGRKAATALGWTHRLDLTAAAEPVGAWYRRVAAGQLSGPQTLFSAC
ncbi:hypothetical protein [Streptomyces sp. NPDC014733]|uniref:hypothetical protein n=1 Tax=Streptomyces sp. NPDC014733 TaxID=3364885 RepID=UPI003700F558